MSFLGTQCRHSDILNSSTVSKAIRHMTIPSESLECGLSACQVPTWIRSFPTEIFPPQSRCLSRQSLWESIFSLDHFSAIAADLHYVLLLGQPLPEFLCTAWQISSQPAPSVPLVLSQRVLLVSPVSRTYFGHLRSIVKIEKSSLIISVSPEPPAYGPFLPDTCHVHLPLSFISLPWMHQIQYSIHFPTFRQHPPAP